MKKKFVYLAMVILLGGISIFTACKKDNEGSEGMTKVQIKMTDAPGNFEKINLNVTRFFIDFSPCRTALLERCHNLFVSCKITILDL